MEEANKDLIRRMIKRVDAEGETAYADFVVPDVIWHASEIVEDVKAAFTNLKHTIEEMIAEDDKLAVRFTARAVNTGEFMNISPSGKEVAFTVLGIYRIADGMVVEGWFEFDTLGLIEQIKE